MKYQIAILFTFALFQAPAAHAINPKVFTELAKASEEVSSLRKQAAQATSGAARGQLLLQASEREADAVLMKEFLRADPKMKIHQLAKETLYLHKKVEKGQDLYVHDIVSMPGNRSGDFVGLELHSDVDELKDWIKDNKKEMKSLAKQKYKRADGKEITSLRDQFMSSSTGQRAVLHAKINKRLSAGAEQNVRRDADRTGSAPMVDQIETIVAAGARPTLPRRIDGEIQRKIANILEKNLRADKGWAWSEQLKDSFLGQGRFLHKGNRSVEQGSRMSAYADLAEDALAQGVKPASIASAIDKIEDLLTNPQPSAGTIEEAFMKSVRNEH